MVIATTSNANGQQMLLVGITDEHVERLKAGQPLSVDLAKLGRLGRDFASVNVFYMPTTDELMKALEPYISLDTKIKFTPDALRRD